MRCVHDTHNIVITTSNVVVLGVIGLASRAHICGHIGFPGVAVSVATNHKLKTSLLFKCFLLISCY